MHRDRIQGCWSDRVIRFDAAVLKAAGSTLELTSGDDAWTCGVLYDYLQLEVGRKE
jgi:hypothetical protein